MNVFTTHFNAHVYIFYTGYSNNNNNNIIVNSHSHNRNRNIQENMDDQINWIELALILDFKLDDIKTNINISFVVIYNIIFSIQKSILQLYVKCMFFINKITLD